MYFNVPLWRVHVSIVAMEKARMFCLYIVVDLNVADSNIKPLSVETETQE
jgi:hypothetical protein